MPDELCVEQQPEQANSSIRRSTIYKRALGFITLLWVATVGALFFRIVDPRWAAGSFLLAWFGILILAPLAFRRGLRSGRVIAIWASITVASLVVIDEASECSFCGDDQDGARLFVQQSVRVPLASFRLAVGRYPSTEEGLRALLVCPSGLEGHWKGPYLEPHAKLVDPWGHPYQYRYPGLHNTQGPDIWSLGPDGVPSGDDTTNWGSSPPR